MNSKQSNFVFRKGLAISIGVASIFGSSLSGAADDDKARLAANSTTGSSAALETIIVTAERREESLQDVPLSVTAVTADALAIRGVNGLADLQPGSVPGVLIGQFAGTPSVLLVNIRGVGLSDSTQGTTEMAVPVYIDGVFLGRGQGLGLDLIEPERVEILRGPQGQLFGRNAEGGVVQYVSKKPSGEFGVHATASFGNYTDQRYKASVDLPSVGGFAVQLSGVKSKHRAYSEQSPKGVYADQFDYGFLDSTGFRAAVRWKNDGGFTADYAFDRSYDTDSQPALTWVPNGNPVNPLFAAIVPPSEDYPGTVNQPVFNTPFKVGALGHALTLAWRQSDQITWKSISSYREASRHGGSTLSPALPAGLTGAADFSAFGFLYPYAGEFIDQHQASQEFQFIGTWSQFDLTAGAIYYKETVRDERQSAITGPGLQNPLDFFAPAGLAFCAQFQLDPCPVGDNRQGAESKSWGIYTQGSYRPASLNDKLELSAGLRYTDDKKDANRSFSLTAGGPVDLNANFKTSRVDPAATIRYQWTQDLNTYLRFSRGYRAGGANVRSSSFTSFGAEVNNAWELGLKSRFADDRVQLNVALFYNTVKGEQLTIQEQPTVDPSLTNTINSPHDKKVKGVEAELQWRALERLQLGLNYTYMDTDKFYDVGNPFGGGSATRFYQVYTPENSVSVSAD